MNILRKTPISLGILLIGCGGGTPEDVPEDMTLYTAINGYLSGARACLVSSEEIKSFGEQGIDCHSFEAARSKVTVDGFVAYETKDLRPYLLVDVIPEFVIDKGQVGYAKNRYQLITLPHGNVASPFSTVAYLMKSNISEVSRILGLPADLISSDYVKVSNDVGSYDAARAEAIGRSLVREFPSVITPSSRDSETYMKLLESLSQKSFEYTQVELKNLEFTVKWSGGNPMSIEEHSIAPTLEYQLIKEPHGWTVHDVSKDMFSGQLQFTGGSVMPSADGRFSSLAGKYKIDEHDNLVFANGDVERFFYSSGDFMLSDIVVPLHGMGEIGTAKVWVNHKAKLGKDRYKIDKTWIKNRVSHVVALNPSEGNRGYPIHYKLSFNYDFNEIIQGEGLGEKCIYQRATGSALSWDDHNDKKPKHMSFEVRFDCDDREYRDEIITERMTIAFNSGSSMTFSPLSMTYEDSDLSLLQGDDQRLYIFAADKDLASNLRWRWSREHTLEEL